MMTISDEGWIEWKGGKRPPFPVGTKIQVNFRGDNLVEGYPDEFRWSYSAVRDTDMDIIAYRIVEPVIKPEVEEATAPVEKDWIEWNGGECPAPYGTRARVKLRCGELLEGLAGEFAWTQNQWGSDIIAYRIAKPAETTQAKEPKAHGGKLSGDHYYRVTVSHPIAPDVQPYMAECADIIEALHMTFNEGEAFKAIWRLAAGRLGRVKPGSAGMQYDADKVAHYGVRVAEHTRLRG
jgi:hypothetical protein